MAEYYATVTSVELSTQSDYQEWSKWLKWRKGRSCEDISMTVFLNSNV
jgi:hypothetical protein